MLPSSYTRRLRTQDLLTRSFQLHDSSTNMTKKPGRVDFSGTLYTHAYLPYIHRQKTQVKAGTRVSGQIDLMLANLAAEKERVREQETELYRKKLAAAGFKEHRDTPMPGTVVATVRKKRPALKGKLDPIAEKSSTTPVVLDILDMDQVLVLFRTLMKDRAFSRCLRQNDLRLDIQNPVIIEGLPAWSQQVQSEVNAIVSIKTIRFSKFKVTRIEPGYIEVNLPKKIPRAKKDLYEELRATEETKLSISGLNKGLFNVFSEALAEVKFEETDTKPELCYDELTEAIEMVYAKHLKVPIIPAIFISNDEPLYVLRPNYPDLDPTSDTLWRASYLGDEERILDKISGTDKGLRLEALKVIHRLCMQDWRLNVLTVYQLKNVLMHDVDFEIDHSPRWQRITRDACVQSLLKRLLYFVKKKKLPLFFNSQIDLFKNLTKKYLGLMRTPLERLVSNEEQLFRDLQRASRNEDYASSSSDDSW